MNPAPSSLRTLLHLEDEAFVHAAYLMILKRPADENGLRSYTLRLRLGDSKIDVLSQLRRSPEGLEQVEHVHGIDAAINRHQRNPLRRLLRFFRGGDKATRQAQLLAEQLHALELRLTATKAELVALAHAATARQSGAIVQLVPDTTCLLQPVREVATDVSGSGAWASLGLDPQFAVIFVSGGLLQAGWYELRLTMDFDGDQASSKFYFNYGSGFDEASSVVLRHAAGKGTSQWLCLEERAVGIRFDPLDRAGRFRIVDLDFRPSTESQAVAGMLQTLQSLHFWHKGKTEDSIRQSITAKGALRKKTFSIAVLHEYQGLTQDQTIGYQDWIDSVESPAWPDSTEVAEIVAALADAPKISLLLPVFNTPESYLKECIESIRSQSFSHWELCIADDASIAPHVRPLLERYASGDPRIKVQFRTRNGHISECSNSALAMVSGDYVALVDHDDVLAKHALLLVARAIAAQRRSMILYSDEDKIDGDGRRFDPCFKTDWNPDLLLTGNYVSHLGVYRTELLRRIGGFRAGFEGSQDHDLILRCLPLVQREQVIHIPKILYHWRAAAGSTALSATAKSYTNPAAKRALGDYFAANGPAGVEVSDGVVANTYRIRYPLPDPPPLVSLLVPTRDHLDLLETCVASILQKTTYTQYEILILDNQSVAPATLKYFAEIQRLDSRVRVLRYDAPFNYSAINNFGVTQSAGSVIGLINNDIEVISADWLSEMVSHAVRPGVGCVGAKLYYSDDTIQHGGVICGLGGVACHSHKDFPRDHPGYFGRLMLTQAYSAVTGACLVVRRSIYDEVGGLDAEHLAVAFNDVDFCLRVDAAGYRNIWTPYAELYHHESVSRGKEDTPEKMARFSREIDYMKRVWIDRLNHDPYYNPNLTRNKENFSLGA